MNVLVMGGSAFNGRALVPALAEAGHDVTVCNRGRTPIEYPAGVAHLAADRTDHDALRAVLGGTEWDCVIDMTAYHPADVALMVELFADAVGHYIYVSSTVTYASISAEHPGPIDENHPDDRGPDQFEYGLDKLLAEDLLQAAHADAGFPATTVPLAMVFGPHNALPGREQRMFSRMRLGRPILVPGDGTTKAVIGHVDDQARAFEALMGVEASFGRRLNLTGDDPHDDNRYVEVIADAMGVQPDIVDIPAELMDDLWDKKVRYTPPGGSRPTMDIRPTEAARDRVMPHIHKGPLANLIQRLQPSIHRWDSDTVFTVDAMKDVTGWTPQHTFDTAVADTYRWWSGTDLHRTVEQDYGYEDEIVAMIRG
ncbi:MAG: NAD-dependent epimerase/dehydratase family protein [Acidimicrobiales bacterium]|nr:NAD-dependent epimerase/dehydratase family protein [Acidimicrobiales bacterium]